MFKITLKFVLLAYSLSVVAFGQDKSGAEKGSYDSFRNITTVNALLASKSYPISKDYMLMYSMSPKLDKYMTSVNGVAIHEGQVPKVGGLKSVSLEIVVINFPSSSAANGTIPIYLVGGTQRFELSGTSKVLSMIQGPRGTQMSVGATITITAPLDAKLIDALMKTDKLEIRLGNDWVLDFLGDEALSRFRTFYSEVSGGGDSSVAATLPNPVAVSPKKVSSIMEVASDMPGFTEVPVLLTAQIAITNYYNYEYRKSQDTHFAFEIKDSSGRGYVYMPRGERAEKLRKAIINLQPKIAIGTFTIVIKRDRFKPNEMQSTLMAELLDFQ